MLGVGELATARRKRPRAAPAVAAPRARAVGAAGPAAAGAARRARRPRRASCRTSRCPSTRPGRCRRCSCCRRARAARRAPRCGAACCTSSTSRSRPPPGAACSAAPPRRVRCELLAAFPRTGGPLLVLALDGRRIRAQETTLWMTRTALRRIPAMPAKLRPKRLLLEPVATDRIDLAGPPRAKPGQLRTLVTIYRSAGYQYGIDWRVLAAINRVETNFGRNTHVSSAGAVGWMQFLPSTWRRWGVDASGDGVADPYDPQDAIFSAARYLDAAGARAGHPPRGLRVQPRQLVRQRGALDRGLAARQLRRLSLRRARCRRRGPSNPPPTARRRARRPPACARGAPRADGGRRDSAQRKRSRASSSRPESPSSAAVARPARARERMPRSAGSTARSERSSRTSSSRHSGQGRSAGRSTAGPLHLPHTGQP